MSPIDVYVASNSKRVKEVCKILDLAILAETAWLSEIGWSFLASTYIGSVKYEPSDDRLVFLVVGYTPNGPNADGLRSKLKTNRDKIKAVFPPSRYLTIDVIEWG